MNRALTAWSFGVLLSCAAIYAAFAPKPHPDLDPTLGPWLQSCLTALQNDQPLPGVPRALEALSLGGGLAGLDGLDTSGVLELWHQGKPVAAQHIVGELHVGVLQALEALAKDPAARALINRGASSPRLGLYLSLTVPISEGPLLLDIPLLSQLGLVPMRDGVSAALEGEHVVATPHGIWSQGLLDRAVKTPIPDLSFGVDVTQVIDGLAQRLGVSAAQLRAEGRLRRLSALTIAPEAYPLAREDDRSRVNVANLHRSVRQGAAFLMRHQASSGRFAYVYDAAEDRVSSRAGYNWARHAGTAFFLAQAAHQLGDHKARKGALRALRYVRSHVMKHCGPEQNLCVSTGPVARLGASALTALAAAEVLRSGESTVDLSMLRGLTRHLHAVQRPDGELMHDFDLRSGEPVDVQRMYYSGEAALALLAAYRLQRRPEDLAAVSRLMKHLTGAGWRFFGSRYFYGEEHWTCQAVAEAHNYLELPEALEFCLRWSGFQNAVQFRDPRSPWDVHGAYGVGPLIVPRVTAIASRVEAGAAMYRQAKKRGYDVTALRGQMQAAVGVLLRYQWSPGPVHLLKNPFAAHGGFPATQAALSVRNDFVQHSASAMLAWAQVLDEQAPHAAK